MWGDNGNQCGDNTKYTKGNTEAFLSAFCRILSRKTLCETGCRHMRILKERAANNFRRIQSYPNYSPTDKASWISFSIRPGRIRPSFSSCSFTTTQICVVISAFSLGGKLISHRQWASGFMSNRRPFSLFRHLQTIGGMSKKPPLSLRCLRPADRLLPHTGWYGFFP